jgi:hypothetical protein
MQSVQNLLRFPKLKRVRPGVYRQCSGLVTDEVAEFCGCSGVAGGCVSSRGWARDVGSEWGSAHRRSQSAEVSLFELHPSRVTAMLVLEMAENCRCWYVMDRKHLLHAGPSFHPLPPSPRGYGGQATASRSPSPANTRGRKGEASGGRVYLGRCRVAASRNKSRQDAGAPRD